MDHCGTTTLTTARLTLRRFTLDDAPTMFANWANDPQVTRFLTWQPHGTLEVTKELLASWLADYQQPTNYQWAIELRELGQPIGSIGVVALDEAVSSFEIGYCIGSPWWRQGIMSEALSAVIDFLFAEVGALRVCAKHDTRNPNSGRVMRHCGLLREGVLRQAGRSNEGIGDICVHGILRSEWEARRKKS